MENWKKTLIVVGGTAAAAGVIYFLLRDEPEGTVAAASETDKRKSPTQYSKDEVKQILDDINASQEQMKVQMKAVTTEIMKKDMSFEETYKKIREVQPDDVLERHGLQMNEFDQLLVMYQSDPQIREGIRAIMGGNEAAPAAGKAKDVSVQTIVEAHRHMLEVLESVIEHANKSPEKGSYEVKGIALTAQAIIAARVEQKYGLTNEDMETAIMKYQRDLATDQDFAAINMKMQQLMGQLMGHDFR
eukprot:CAMPEP_0206450410 /NCGR_PEP_ID=MMETSP0324_2-20121206/18703_1 /ASSEMBLY_ACC=CAM_ASM_000836 /TAXON_ID=2866 /ORGANISM="Crypthecodinium cohnii, Strain Seligo" /LENGTH=244 /DNA_ID=CAMNT_0053920043 /DNA_START=88 /DNA_END=822 /DNA_ORIENTATION=-